MTALKCRLVSDDLLMIEFSGRSPAVVSTVPLTGGLRVGVKYAIIRRVSKSLNVGLKGLRRLVNESLRLAGLGEGEAVVILTAASVKDYVIINYKDELSISVVMTSGLSPAACVEVESTYKVPKPAPPSTVSIVVGVDERLTDAAALDLMRTVIESKSSTFADLLLRCGSRAFGTVTDNVTIMYRRGRGGIPWAGPATELGHRVALMVRNALLESGLRGLSIEDMLENAVGLSIRELVDLALSAYSNSPVPGVDRLRVRKLVEGAIKGMLKDPNVWSFIIAARELDLHGGAGTIPGLTSEEFEDDTVRMLADELIGISLATYVAGSKALFTMYWIERIKGEGTLKAIGNLPMFEDDVVSAIIASALTKVYDELLRC